MSSYPVLTLALSSNPAPLHVCRWREMRIQPASSSNAATF